MLQIPSVTSMAASSRETVWSPWSSPPCPPCKECSRARRSLSWSAMTNCWITAAAWSAPLLFPPHPHYPPPPPRRHWCQKSHPVLPGGTMKRSMPSWWRSCRGSTWPPTQSWPIVSWIWWPCLKAWLIKYYSLPLRAISCRWASNTQPPAVRKSRLNLF